MRRGSLIAGALVVFAGQAGMASASTAFVGPSDKFSDGAAVHYVADPGETNDVRIVGDLSGVGIRDTGATITAGSGCTSISPTRVRCSDPDGIVEASLGDGDDVLRSLLEEEDNAVWRGDAGNDRLDGGFNAYGAVEYLFGGSGNDVLRGMDGDDVLDGGSGSDLMSGGTSCDALTAGICAVNLDTVSYARRGARVRADADVEAADDGQRGEGDTILSDVEVIIGGRANDVLGGTTTNFTYLDAVPYLVGMTLEGRAGNDILRGTRAPDQIRGGSGNDLLRGAERSDRLLAGRGADKLVGNKGRDRLGAGKGPDTLYARDRQKDHVNGGPGTDVAQTDAMDRIRKVEKLLP